MIGTWLVNRRKKNLLSESTEQEEAAVSHESEEKRFEDLLEKSTDVLIRVKSVFPFDLFPTEITVTIHKIDVVFNSFFTKKVQPVYIKNISDVYVTKGFYLSTLHLIDTDFVNNTLTIENLKNKDALEAMKIIQGLVVSTKQQIDLTKIDIDDDFVKKVKVIGAPSGGY